MATKKQHTRFDSPKAALENYAIALQNLERCLWDNFGEAARGPVVAGISKGPDSDQFGVSLTVFLYWESICCQSVKLSAGNSAPSLARLTFVECALSSQLASNQAERVLFLSGHGVVVCRPKSFTLSPCGGFQDTTILSQSLLFQMQRVIFFEAAMQQAMCFLKLEKFQEAEAGCGNCRPHHTIVFTFVGKWPQQQIDERRGLLQLWWQMHPTAKPCGNPVESSWLFFCPRFFEENWDLFSRGLQTWPGTPKIRWGTGCAGGLQMEVVEVMEVMDAMELPYLDWPFDPVASSGETWLILCMMNLIKFFHIVYKYYINTHSNLTESKLIRNDSRFTFDIMSYFMLDVRIMSPFKRSGCHQDLQKASRSGSSVWVILGSRFHKWHPNPWNSSSVSCHLDWGYILSIYNLYKSILCVRIHKNMYIFL